MESFKSSIIPAQSSSESSILYFEKQDLFKFTEDSI